VTTRVQIPAYTDRWMMGDRYGEVVKVGRTTESDNVLGKSADTYTVKLDKSGKHIRVYADDCTEIA
jgi:hypothetical protein